VGYVVIQPRVDAALKIVDTCGVHNLHGMPGLLGGLTAALLIPGIAKAQTHWHCLHGCTRLRVRQRERVRHRIDRNQGGAYQDR